MLVVKTKEIFLLNLHQNRVHFPVERNAFVLNHQHGRRDVTCKPAIIKIFPGHILVSLKYIVDIIKGDLAKNEDRVFFAGCSFRPFVSYENREIPRNF